MKKKSTGLLLMMLIVILTFALTACGEEPTINVTGIDAADIKDMLVGESETISVNIQPYNATNKKYEIKLVEDNGVISVDNESGLVVAKKTGTAKILIKAANNISRTITVNVVANATDINYQITEEKALKKAKEDAYYVVVATGDSNGVGKDIKINASVVPPATLEFVDMTFKSSDESVATVDNEGNVHFKNPAEFTETTEVITQVKRVTITIKVDNKRADDLTKEILFQVCPYNKSTLNIDLDPRKIRIDDGSANGIAAQVNGNHLRVSNSFRMQIVGSLTKYYVNINASQYANTYSDEAFTYEPTGDDMDIKLKVVDTGYITNIAPSFTLGNVGQLLIKVKLDDNIIKLNEENKAIEITITEKVTGQQNTTNIKLSYVI